MICNKRELADILGSELASPRSITNWQHEDPPLPVVHGRRGRQSKYNTGAVILWLLQRFLRRARVEKPRDTLDRKRSEEIDFRLEIKRGEWMRTADVNHFFFTQARTARNALLSLPDKLAGILAIESDPVRVRELLSNAVHELCEEIAAGIRKLDQQNDKRRAA